MYLTCDIVSVASLLGKNRLRSVKSKNVVFKSHKLKSRELEKFSFSGSKLWNDLPISLKFSC